MLSMIFAACGLWALVTGKIPSGILGGKKYRIEGVWARVIGAILMLPLPIGFMLGLVLTALWGDLGTRYAITIDSLLFVIVLLLVVIISHLVRKPAVAAA